MSAAVRLALLVVVAAALAGCASEPETVTETVTTTEPPAALTQTDVGEIRRWIVGAYDRRHSATDGSTAERYGANCAATGPQTAACTLRVFVYDVGDAFPTPTTASVSVSCRPSGAPEPKNGDFSSFSGVEQASIAGRIKRMLASCTWVET